MAGRALSSKIPSLLSSSLIAAASRPLLPSSLHHLRPLFALADTLRPLISLAAAPRCFSTRATTSSLNDPSPNWSNRPPKETILLEGCDFEHWLCVLEPLDPNLTRDEIIDIYIKTLAEVVGSEDEARMKIYSVSTKHYFAFGALVSEEVSLKIKTLPKVRWVLPDSYLDVKNKDYGGEPFINGQAVPYDPKYHEEWVRNNSRANERNRRNDRPRNNDRSRNFERRRDTQNFQNRGASPMSNQDFQNPTPPPPRDMPPPMYSNNTSPNPMPPRETPPMSNRNFNAGDPPRAYPNQAPNPQGSYAPVGPAYQGNNQGYQGGNPGGLAGHQGNGPNPQGSYAPAGPVYHGNNQGYQGGNPGGSAAHQGNGQGYQGGPPGYPGGSPNYGQGGGPNYQRGGIPSYQQQGGGPSYQQSSPNYQPAGPGYTPGGQGGDPNYRPPPGPSYQQGSQGSSPAYEARDVPGRDQ